MKEQSPVDFLVDRLAPLFADGKEIGDSSPWLGVKCVKKDKKRDEKNDKPEFNRLGQGMALLAEADRVTIFLSPGQVLPEERWRHLPQGAPPQGISREVCFSTDSQGRIKTKHGSHLFSDIAHALGQMGILATHGEFDDVLWDIMTLKRKVTSPFVLVQCGRSIPKTFAHLAYSSPSSMIHVGTQFGLIAHEPRALARSWDTFTALGATTRDEITAAMDGDAQVLTHLSPAAKAYLARLPSLPVDRDLLIRAIHKTGRAGDATHEANTNQLIKETA